MYEVELDDEKVILYDETILKFNLLTKKHLRRLNLKKLKLLTKKLNAIKNH